MCNVCCNNNISDKKMLLVYDTLMLRWHECSKLSHEHRVDRNYTIAVKWEAKAEAYKEAANILANVVSEWQPPKFKEGDMVYLIGFDCLKPHKLLSTGDAYSTMKFRVIIDDDNSKTFTKDGRYLNGDIAPSIVLATEDNRKMLNKLLGVEYEPVKLTGSDLAKEYFDSIYDKDFKKFNHKLML